MAPGFAILHIFLPSRCLLGTMAFVFPGSLMTFPSSNRFTWTMSRMIPILFLILAQACWGQIPFQEGVELRDKMKELSEKWLKQPDEESAGELIRLLSFHPQTLVRREKSSLVPLARWANELLAGVSEEKSPLRLRQWNVQVKKKLEESSRRGDLQAVQLIARTAAGVEAGALAGLWLGDLALESGNLEEAVFWWKMPLFPLAPPASTNASGELKARVILAEMCRGNDSGSFREKLNDFLTQHPNASGSLLGKKGNYKELFTGLIKKDLLPHHADWSDYAACPERNSLVPSRTTPQKLGHWCSLDPLLQVTIGEEENPKKGPAAPRLFPPIPSPDLTVHPLIVEPWLIHQEGTRILATHLGTGKTQKWFDAGITSSQEDTPGKVHALAFVPPSFVVACLGSEFPKALFPLEGATPPPPFQGKLVCLKVNEKGAELQWQAAYPLESASRFDSPPLCHQGRVVTAVRTQKEGKETVRLYCHFLDSRQEGELIWTLEPASDSGGWGALPGSQSALVRCGTDVIWTGRNGAMAAVEIATGVVRWARVPEAAEPKKGPSNLSATKTFFSQGGLFTLVEGKDLVRGIDPYSGTILWERECPGANGLIGGWDDRVIVATENGLRALNTFDGSDKKGWTAPGDGAKLPSSGKGFLLGQTLVWPTVKGIFSADMQSGLPAADLTIFHNAPPGNLALSGGYFISAGRVFISVYASEEKWKKHGVAWPKESPSPAQSSGKDAGNSNESPSQSLRFDFSPLQEKVKWRAEAPFSGNTGGVSSIARGKDCWYWLHDQALERRKWDGALVWKTLLPFPCAWIEDSNETALVAGYRGVVGLEAATGKEKWRALVPHGLKEGKGSPFSAGPWLVCARQGSGLAVIDTVQGRLEWESHLPGSGWPLPGAHWNLGLAVQPSFAALFLPDSLGGLWLLNFTEKKLQKLESGQGVAWASTASLPGRFFGLKVNGEIQCRDALGSLAWKMQAVPATWSTGAPGILRTFDESLIAGIPTNLGFLLQRLAADRPRALWPKPLLLPEVNSPAQVQVINRVALVPVGGKEALVDLESGKEIPGEIPSAKKGDCHWNCISTANRTLLWTNPQPSWAVQVSWLGCAWEFQPDGIYPKGIELLSLTPSLAAGKSLHLNSYAGRGSTRLDLSPYFFFVPELRFRSISPFSKPVLLSSQEKVLVHLPGTIYCLQP